jgi:glycerate 2-kinase
LNQPPQFHPFQLDTLGLGLMLKALRDSGARRMLVGIGGSATNDGGFGLARALGWQFLSRDGKPIERWTGLSQLSSIAQPEKPFELEQLTVATDVSNPLLGPRGATRIYAPQKGLTARQLPFAELCLRRLARVAARQFGRNCAKAAGAGAAGGLGFGLVTFAGGRVIGGFELFAEQARLDQRLRQAQLVITGEGALDHSSLMGKGVGRVACRCRELGVPCIGIAGTVALGPSLVRTFTAVHALTELTSLRVSKSAPATWLERLGHEVAKNWTR